MTAEIAILNKSAVALAADSKVTVGSSGRQKTYDTVNKVFTLSKLHPVGVMIYGNAEFMGYAWELVVKQFRREIGNQYCSTVREWSERFLSFVMRFGKIDKEEKYRNTIEMLCSWFEELEQFAYSRATRAGVEVPSAGYVDILCGVFSSFIDQLNRERVLFTDAQIDTFQSEYLGVISDAISRSLPSHDERTSDLAIAFAVRAIFHDRFSPLRTGIVIAGFGEAQLFPELISFETDGYIGDSVKISENSNTVIDKEMRSCVQSFAQSDMTNRFMDGIDNSYSNWLSGAFEDALTTSCLTVLSEYGKRGSNKQAIRDAVVESAQKQARDLSQRATKYRKDKFSRPILDMVALLPKDELSQMAESLVALTSFKRRVSTDVETVGGPVDVAVISKEDGFVWIKRKHYFKPELNPHFINLYMHDVIEQRRGGSDDSEHRDERNAGSNEEN